MATSGAPERRPRRGPAPIASFDHDVSDESSPESKQTARLPEIREEGVPTPSEARARSLSTPAVGGLPTPRIDISRASSSSHQDSRDSSPDLALFAGASGEESRARLELGFREDGALDLRSSTEELAFLEDTPGETRPAPPARRHSRKDSQSSEAALLAVSGRTSRLSSVGSQCSALSRTSRLSVVSSLSRSPSPHKMLVETSFCGPRPIETDPELCAAAVEERLLEIAKLSAPLPDARDRREVRTEVTVEPPRPPPASPAPTAALLDSEPRKETANEIRAERCRAPPRLRREPSEPEVYKQGNRTKNVIRIKLKPDEDYEEETERSEEVEEVRPEPDRAARPTVLAAQPAPSSALRESRTPSPTGPSVSRKSSFCSLFKSRETIASPDSPSEALRRKRSLTEGGVGRSKSRDRSITPTSTGKIRGSVLSLFRTSRRSVGSASPNAREGSPVVRPRAPPLPAPATPHSNERLKYYDDTRDGIIHIPLRTPPEERSPSRRQSDNNPSSRDPPRPASAPIARSAPEPDLVTRPPSKPIERTVLPDGSIIIPLHSPTERVTSVDFLTTCATQESTTTESAAAVVTSEPLPTESRAAADGAEASPARERIAPVTAPLSSPAESDRQRRPKERIVFTTHVGSREQVFSTQFSITKTPSVASEISGSFPSFGEGEAEADGPGRNSSESSSEGGTARAGSEAERRRLVVQDSFEEELPYVPTTLPLERSVALPMVPVRERGGVRVAPLQRPRAAPPQTVQRTPRAPPPTANPDPSPQDKLRIRLPHRARGTPSRARSRSGGDGGPGAESQPRDWIDFEEVPERRKQPKRIQTLPPGAGGGAGSVVFSYVEPDQCRCECHGHTQPQPLLRSTSLEDGPQSRSVALQLDVAPRILADVVPGE